MKPAIIKALDMIRAGSSVYRAARECGVSQGYLSLVCHDIGVAQNPPKTAGSHSLAMRDAINLVRSGMSQRAAAKAKGVTETGLCRALKNDKVCPKCGRPL
jgi:transposase-like protein